VISTVAKLTGLHAGEFLPPLVACCAYALGYGIRARSLAKQGRPVESWRVTSFFSGVILLTVVQIGPLDSLADSVLIAHMAQHILIGDIASLLVVLGLTGPLLAPWLSLPISKPVRVLGHPVVAIVLWAGDLYVWHLPLLYQLAVRHDLVHALEHACMFWFGFALWFALLGPLPKPAWFNNWARLGYVVVVRLAGAVLANVLIWTEQVIYPIYRPSDAAHGLNPLSDQNGAGALMMVEQMLLTALLLCWLFYRASSQDEERQNLLDLAADRGVVLTDARAARAVAAGTGARLRSRILEAAREPIARVAWSDSATEESVSLHSSTGEGTTPNGAPRGAGGASQSEL
jgi:cytochrome c oxidase assembly factor CtaG